LNIVASVVFNFTLKCGKALGVIDKSKPFVYHFAEVGDDKAIVLVPLMLILT
jgi:hypothetical protein